MTTDLKNHISNFKEWLGAGSVDASEWQEGRTKRLEWYRKHLAREHVGQLTESEFATLIKDLWASNVFTNKDYKVRKLIEDNGLDKLRKSLETLLYGEGSIEIRWDAFRSSIKGLGPASLSEILAFFDPQKYALINLKPYSVLPAVGLTIDSVVDGNSYRTAVEQLGKIKKQLEENGVPDADFILTDFFVAYLFSHVFKLQRKRRRGSPTLDKLGEAKKKTEPSVASPSLPINTHEGAQAALLMLGKLLNFDTYTADPNKEHDGQKLGDLATLKELPDFAGERAMGSARRIDVVWVDEEWPECFFEVEQSTGVMPGLHRMFQVIRVDAKFFVVAPEVERGRFGREVNKAPYKGFKQKYYFRSYDELREMYLTTANYRKTADKFLA